jgi:hypothetical protein
VRAVPRTFGSAIFVVAVTAESFGIVLFIFMSTLVNFFAQLRKMVLFFMGIVDVIIAVFLGWVVLGSLLQRVFL